MNATNPYKGKADQAWSDLYSRLKREDLLCQEKKIPFFRRIKYQQIAASTIIICIFLTPIFYFTQNRHSNTLSLANGETSTTLITTLEDGSIIYLGENAKVHYPKQFNDNERKIAFEGTGFFDINKAENNPFIIDTKEASIKVLGTSFEIASNKNSSFELSVKTGEVLITVKKNMENHSIKAGEKAIIESNSLKINREIDHEKFSYYTKRIKFKNERLADMLHVINKEFPDTPILSSPSLEDRRFTVAFDKNTIEEITEIISIALHATCKKEQNKFILSE